MAKWACWLALIVALGCGRSALDGAEDADGTGGRDATVDGDGGGSDGSGGGSVDSDSGGSGGGDSTNSGGSGSGGGSGGVGGGVGGSGAAPLSCEYLQRPPTLVMQLDGLDSVLDEVVIDPEGGFFVSTSGCASRYSADAELSWAASADVYCGRMAYDAARSELLVAAANGVDGVTKSLLWAYDINGALAWDASAGPDINQNSVTYATASGRDGSALAIGMALDGLGALTWVGAYEPVSGTLRWFTSLREATASVNRRIAVDAAGSIYMMHTHGRVAQLAKLDQAGELMWIYDRGSEDADLAQGIDMAVEPDGTVVLLGVLVIDGVREWFVDRISPDGEQLWSLDTLESPWLEEARSVAVGPCGEIVLTGSVDEAFPFWLGRLEADGTQNWAVGAREGTPLDAAVREDGSFVVVGYASDGRGWVRGYDPG